MDYNIKVIRGGNQVTSQWSGGTTTQLAIYPENSDYSKRNFKWRLSSARVDLDESTFTNLPGIKRLIMPIEGEMKLEHEGHYKVVLKPFEQDCFWGDWSTRSFGKVRDFNLMMAEGVNGLIEGISLKDGTKFFTYNYEKSEKIFETFYAAHGNAKIEISSGYELSLNEGDFILIEVPDFNEPLNIEIEAIGGGIANIVRANIII